MYDLQAVCGAADLLPPQPGETPEGWIGAKLSAVRPFLLAYDDAGVIWGRWSDTGLLLPGPQEDPAGRYFSQPALDWESLQELFLFGAQDEIHLFHAEMGGWQVRWVTDPAPEDMVVEKMVLWGDQVVADIPGEFTWVRESTQQALDQALPLVIEPAAFGKDRGLAYLEVHHFIVEDRETGETRIALSRLAGVEFIPADEEVSA